MSIKLSVAGVLFVVVCAPASAKAQVAQPGQAAAEEGKQQEEGQPAGGEATAADPTAPAPAPKQEEPRYTTVVVGEDSEADLMGPYAQPRWTTRRRFPNTRVYVRPPGDVEFEWWLEGKFDLSGDNDRRMRSQYEVELGLGHRLQLDIYLTTQQIGEGPFELHEEKFELRYALADWGKLPGNPTLYVEWARQHDAPDKGEAKALFGGALSSRMYWGTNVVIEREMGGSHEHEYALTGGLAYVLVDGGWSVGGEVKLETVDVDGDRLAFDAYEVLAGPSIQWLPAGHVHIDLVLPIGFEVEGDETTPVLQPLLVLGADI